MVMGKLTAKLRDAVPVCLLVEGREIKRYKNIEIPDEIKKLEYMSFKFDVPLNGNITFKISFAPGVLPEELPQVRERKKRALTDALVAKESDVPVKTPIAEDADDPMQDNTVIESLATGIVENASLAAVDKEDVSPVEAHNDEENNPETKDDSEVKAAKTSKKTVVKTKRAPVAIKN